MIQIGVRDRLDEAKIRLLRGIGSVGRIAELTEQEPLQVQVLTTMQGIQRYRRHNLDPQIQLAIHAIVLCRE